MPVGSSMQAHQRGEMGEKGWPNASYIIQRNRYGTTLYSNCNHSDLTWLSVIRSRAQLPRANTYRQSLKTAIIQSNGTPSPANWADALVSSGIHRRTIKEKTSPAFQSTHMRTRPSWVRIFFIKKCIMGMDVRPYFRDTWLKAKLIVQNNTHRCSRRSRRSIVVKN